MKRIKWNRVYSCDTGQKLEAGYCKYGSEISSPIKCKEFYG